MEYQTVHWYSYISLRFYPRLRVSHGQVGVNVHKIFALVIERFEWMPSPYQYVPPLSLLLVVLSTVGASPLRHDAPDRTL